MKAKRQLDEVDGLIHPSSCPASKSELSLNHVGPTQTAIERAFTTEYRPVATLTGSTPLIEFLIPASAEHYLDFDDMYLQVRFKIKAQKKNF